ncbi:MAG: hypothetical protein K5866_10695 [Treponema sp.]|nr:hypothetical protein [Treponema sp.]
MKKLLFIFTLSVFTSFIFAQEAENLIEDSESLEIQDSSQDEEEIAESESEEDEWADLFEDAQDLAVEEVPEKEEKQTVINQIIGNPNIKLSGHFDGDIGIGIDFDEIKEHKESEESSFYIPLLGYVKFDNYLYFLAKPSDIFHLNASLYTALDNGFKMELKTFYCDYVPFDGLYTSAGKKSISWGYTRIFSDSDYYGSGKKYTGPLLTNVLSDSSSYFLADARFPWRWGTLSGVVLCDYSDIVAAPGILQMGYAFSSEFSIPHFVCNIFGRTYGVDDTQKFTDVNGDSRYSQKNPLAGIEGKVSFSGYDAYAQGIIRIKNKSNYKYDLSLYDGTYPFPWAEYYLATIGAYKVWDSFDPNLGLNVEYQYQCSPEYGSYDMQHRIALQAGIKRMGKKKNLKLAGDWYHNFTENYGQTSLSFIVANIFNYAQWTNTFVVQYGEKYGDPVYTLGTAIQVDVDY